MSASLLLVTEVHADEADLDLVAKNWAEHNAAHPREDRALYRSTVDATLLELTTLGSLDELTGIRAEWTDLWGALAPSITADFRRQLLHYVEAPKDVETALPQTPYLQMRHVEVRPQMYRAYREWRERTIFDVVRNAPEVEAFVAYHSVVSTEPGVMFVSGFSCDPERYADVFRSERYQQIVREA
ncbi:hypothetical protein, partial [Peterkaempfera griseoplana]|uniref:hypothetical protein n=1 Tax=Peterkaempfera griseoplana TaxID=66896 RepID=UPI0006E35FBA